MHLHNRSCLARTMSALLLFGVLTSSPVIAESPSIRITSPHPGAVVHSGSELEISVDAAPSTLRMALLNGDGPTPTWATLVAAATVANGSATPPYRVSIQIPANASTGAHTLFAVGVRGDGGDVVLSPRVPIDIERPDEPKDMTAELGFQFLDAVGDTKQLNILARFEDGTVVSLSGSHRNVYDIDPPGVVAVSSEGLIRALAPGAARITIRNGHASVVVRVEVAGAAPRRAPVK